MALCKCVILLGLFLCGLFKCDFEVMQILPLIRNIPHVSSWADFSNSSNTLSISKKFGACYIQDDISDEENWGNWNKVDDTDKEKCKEIIEAKIIESPSKPIETQSVEKSIIRHATKPYILGNKDRNIYPIYRNFYEEHPDITNLSFDEVESFLLLRNNIMIQELKTYPTHWDQNDDDINEDQVEILPGIPGIAKPIRTFEEMFWKHPEILDIIKSLKFSSPSPIQCIGWPVILSGRDFIGIAQTGTGKTLTFVLPALIHIEGQVKPRQYRRGPTILILSPTRELAMQIENEILKIHYHEIKSVCCYGGAEKTYQINALRDNPEIVVGTPGRINDLLLMGCLCLKDVSYLVLDEADRMLDMGFEPQVVSIINETRRQRQNIMTSATWPESVRNIALLYMDNPIQVNVGSLDLIACNDVVQEIKFVSNFEKTNALVDIICNMNEDDKIIVFVTRKVQCRSLTKYLDKLIRSDKLGPYANICEIHGDLSQSEREQSLSWFRNGECTILIATNVASRGLDIADITCVVNYDFPNDIEEYVHRVGRTGRAGKIGRSITFINEADCKHTYELRNILIQSNQDVPSWLLNLRQMKYTEQEISKKNNPINPVSKSHKKERINNAFSSTDYFDVNYSSDDYDDYFDEYQYERDPKMNDKVTCDDDEEDVPFSELETVENKKKESINNNGVVEKVIEFHSDCLNELYENEEEGFFDEYQRNLDLECPIKCPITESLPVDNICEYDYEYESDNDNEGWW